MLEIKLFTNKFGRMNYYIIFLGKDIDNHLDLDNLDLIMYLDAEILEIMIPRVR